MAITHKTSAPKPSGKISSAEWNEEHDVDLSDYGGGISVDHIHIVAPFEDAHPFELESPSGQSQGFVIGASQQENPGDPDRGDDVFGWGYNRGSGGAAIDSAEASLAYVIESYWNDGFNPAVLEHYLDYGGDDAEVGGGRLFFLQINRETGLIHNFQWNSTNTKFYMDDGIELLVQLSSTGMTLGGGKRIDFPTGQRSLRQNGATLIHYNTGGWGQLFPEDGHMVLGGDRVIGSDEFDIWVGSPTDIDGTPNGPALRYSATQKWQWSDDGLNFFSFADLGGGAAGRIYYLDPLEASDITGYKKALAQPSTNNETTLVVTGAAGTSDNFLAAFATEPGEPGVSLDPLGTAFRRFWGATSTPNGVARIKVEVYVCDADGGNETLLRSGYSTNFAGTTPVFVVWSYTADTSTPIDLTSRLVYKVYVARVSGPTTFDITLYFDGASHASAVQSTISVTTGSGEPGAPGSVWRNGSGAPLDSLGIDGDYYLDDDTGDVYARSLGSYSIAANIKGPQGDPGAGGGSPFSGGIEIDDASNPYLQLHKSGGTPQDWYLEGQADGSIDFYSSGLGNKAFSLAATGEATFHVGVASLGHHAGVSDASNPYLQLDKTGGTPQTWYLEGQSDGSVDLYSGILSGVAWSLSSAGVMKTKQTAVGSIPTAGAAQDGSIVVADDGAVYYYSGGSRYQLAGTPA
jgi:hypothetical protein